MLLCFNFRNLLDKRLASNKLFVFQNTSKNLIAYSIYLAGFYQKNLKILTSEFGYPPVGLSKNPKNLEVQFL